MSGRCHIKLIKKFAELEKKNLLTKKSFLKSIKFSKREVCFLQFIYKLLINQIP